MRVNLNLPSKLYFVSTVLPARQGFPVHKTNGSDVFFKGDSIEPAKDKSDTEELQQRFETVKQAGKEFLKSVSEDPTLENHLNSYGTYHKVCRDASNIYGYLDHHLGNIVNVSVVNDYTLAERGKPIDLDKIANYAVDMTNRLWETFGMFDKESMSPPKVLDRVLDMVDKIKGSRKINIENIDLLNNANEFMPMDWFLIFSNLIENAVKYSPDGSNINIKAGTEEVPYYPPNGEYVDYDTYMTLSVEDEGIGIPHEDQKALLTSEKPLRGSNTGNIQGTGKGMREINNILPTRNWQMTQITSPLYSDAPADRKGTRIKLFLQGI